MTDRHVSDDDALDLALGEVDEDRRDALARHLARCERCRAEYAAAADTVEHVLAAAPRLAPPPGFSGATLAAMGLGAAAPGDRAGPDPSHPRRHDRRRHDSRRHGPRRHDPPRRRPVRLVGLAAAVVTGVLIGFGAATVLDPRPGGDATQVAAPGPAIVTDAGVRVGTASESWHAGAPVLVVALTGGVEGQRYTCVLVHADGTREPAGSWVLYGPGGATWVVSRPETGLVGLDLVTETGVTWAAATW